VALVGGNSKHAGRKRKHYVNGTDQKLKTLKTSMVPAKKAVGKGVVVRDAKVVNPEQVIPMEDEDFKDF
jgi:hypothetical protein